jgi:hypothetical protein
MKVIFKYLELPTVGQIITVQILRFLAKDALMPGGQLTREVVRSNAQPVGPSNKYVPDQALINTL